MIVCGKVSLIQALTERKRHDVSDHQRNRVSIDSRSILADYVDPAIQPGSYFGGIISFVELEARDCCIHLSMVSPRKEHVHFDARES